MRFIQRAVLATGVFAAGLWAAGCQQAQAPGSADSRPVAEILASDGLARADLALAARTQDAETAFELRRGALPACGRGGAAGSL
ncbi:MAG: hypothetical protein R3C46_07285 [Hyphomonadaceae bacterium]